MTRRIIIEIKIKSTNRPLALWAVSNSAMIRLELSQPIPLLILVHWKNSIREVLCRQTSTLMVRKILQRYLYAKSSSIVCRRFSV